MYYLMNNRFSGGWGITTIINIHIDDKTHPDRSELWDFRGEEDKDEPGKESQRDGRRTKSMVFIKSCEERVSISVSSVEPNAVESRKMRTQNGLGTEPAIQFAESSKKMKTWVFLFKCYQELPEGNSRTRSQAFCSSAHTGPV